MPLPGPVSLGGRRGLPKPSGHQEVGLGDEARVASTHTDSLSLPALPLFEPDRTWTYSFSSAFLFSMGFLVAGLCYLSYRYITKPPPPPSSLVSGALGRAWAQGPPTLPCFSCQPRDMAGSPWGGPMRARGSEREGMEQKSHVVFKGAHALSEWAAQAGSATWDPGPSVAASLRFFQKSEFQMVM